MADATHTPVDYDPFAASRSDLPPDAQAPATSRETRWTDHVVGQQQPPPTKAQEHTALTLRDLGHFSPTDAPGSAANPYYMRDGDTIEGVPPGAYFVDLNGGYTWKDHKGDLHVTPPTAMEVTGDTLRAFPTGLAEGVTHTLGMGGDVGQSPLFQDIRNKLHSNPALSAASMLSGVGPAMQVAHDLPSSDQLDQGVQGVAGPYYKPFSWQGRMSESIAQQAPQALMPGGGAAARLGRMILPGVASDLAGEATAGTQYEPAARLAGSVVGGMGAEGFAGMRTAPHRMLAEATQGMSKADVNASLDLMRQAKSEFGLDLSFAEAAQQITGNGTGLGRLQRVVEGTREGGNQFAPVIAARPGQVKSAIASVIDQVAPPTANPSALGQPAKDAAQGGIDKVRQAVNAHAQPHYDALVNEHLPPQDLSALSMDPAYAGALQKLRGDPILNGPVAKLPDTNLSVQNEIVKLLKSDAEGARQTETNPQGNNHRAALIGSAASMADARAAAVSPDWRAARDTVAAGHQMFTDPLKAGPTGQIAATTDVKAQTAALYPAQPLEGAPSETRQAIRAMGTTNPDIAAALTRQHLANSANEATQNLQGGPNPYGGARWAATIAGNPEQRATLLAGIDTAAPQVSDKARALLQAMEATGKRQPQGSSTAYNFSDIEDIKGGGAIHNAAKAVLHPLSVPERIGQALDRALLGKNSEALADALLNPDQTVPAIKNARGRLTLSQQLALRPGNH